MIDRDEQPTLFGYPVIVDPTLHTPEIQLRAPTFREVPDPALADRAAFVRSHVEEIIKKRKTSASHRTKGKLLLQRCEEIGDTAAGDEARLEYEMAARADALAEAHVMCLIQRTTVEP